MTNNIKAFLDADALRTQGEWFWESDGLLTMHEDGIHKVSVLTPDYESGSGCSIVSSEADDNFIAAASRIAPEIRQLLAAFEQVCEAANKLCLVAGQARRYELGLAGGQTIDQNIARTVLYRMPLEPVLLLEEALTAAAPYRKKGGV